MFVSASLIFGMLRVHMQCKWCAVLTAPCGEFLVARFRVYFVVSHGVAVKTAKFASASCLSRFCIRPHSHLFQLAFCCGPPTAMAAQAFKKASGPSSKVPVQLLAPTSHIRSSRRRVRMHSHACHSYAIGNIGIYATPKSVVVTSRIVMHVLFIHFTCTDCAIMRQGGVGKRRRC